MKTYLNYLTVSETNLEPSFDVNLEAKRMLLKIKEEIKGYKTVQKDVDLIYCIGHSDYKIPVQFLEKNTKTVWQSFAEKKGIKKRKGTLIYDEELGKYIPRFGPYSKKNLILKSAVLEDEKGFCRLKKEKLIRIRRNREQMISNKKRKQ